MVSTELMRRPGSRSVKMCKPMMREIGLLDLLIRGLSAPLTSAVLENLDEIARNAPIGADSAEK